MYIKFVIYKITHDHNQANLNYLGGLNTIKKSTEIITINIRIEATYGEERCL